MRRDTYLDDADDEGFDEEFMGGEFEQFERIVTQAKDKKRKALQTRRKIEQMMEQRRRREFDEDYF